MDSNKKFFSISMLSVDGYCIEPIACIREKNVKHDACLNVSLVDCKLVAVFHSQQSDGEHSKGHIIINIFLRLRHLYVIKIPLRQSITIG